MKHYPALPLSVALGLLLVAALALPARAQEPTAIPGAELTMRGNLVVEQPVEILFDLKGYEIPHGSSAAVKVIFIQQPEGTAPTVRTGYPRTTITFHEPGVYHIGFLLNEVSKSSCGGLNAKNLLEAQRKWVISKE